MTAKKSLSVAGPEHAALEAARNAEPVTVAVAARGSRIGLLRSLRDNIAAQIDEGVPPRDLASLSKRLVDLAAEIAALEAKEDAEAEDAAARSSAGVGGSGSGDGKWPGAEAI